MSARLLVLALLFGCDRHQVVIGDAPARVCPASLDLEIDGANSRFNPGWTGIAFGVGMAKGSNLSVAITECDDECRRCSFHGPIRPALEDRPVVGQRCLNNTKAACETDADCVENEGPCRFVFPPIASKFGGVNGIATCSLLYLEPLASTTGDTSPAQGVFDFATGEMDMKVFNIVIQSSIGACSNCLGDPSTFDGKLGGVCTNESGPTGEMCDVAGLGTVLDSLTSYDCAPPSADKLSIGLPGASATTANHAWTMDDTRPMCTAQDRTNKHCWCGMCNDSTPCSADHDCKTGRCNATSGMPDAQDYVIDNNYCQAGCAWNDATQSGVCNDDPSIACYPDSGTIVAEGSAEVHDGFYIAQIANLQCMPAFDPLVSQVAGFPGPLLFQARFKVFPRMAP